MASTRDQSHVPSVERVLCCLSDVIALVPRRIVVGEVRRELEVLRTSEMSHPPDEKAIAARVRAAVTRLGQPSLQRVINATGVIVHTNLGRAPFGSVHVIGGYSNLEYDLRAGARGKRDVHIEGLLDRLIGAPGIVVNNNAAAVYLVLNELACGHEVIVSRGELIEIGDGFRIPEIMKRSGAVLREVGTTNCTRLNDYRDAINERTQLLLRVHPSNFTLQGFTARPTLEELCSLAKERNIVLYEDLGSGLTVDLATIGVKEPLIQESLQAGVDLVSFSGDKLLGGPQAGVLAGNRTLIARLRRNPMYRALRVDKMILQVLEGTLRALLFEQWESIPVLQMVLASADDIRHRAERMQRRLGEIDTELHDGESLVGGGSTPNQPLPTTLISVRAADAAAFERRLRACRPPVIARIQEGQVLIDLRTVSGSEEEELAMAVRSAAEEDLGQRAGAPVAAAQG